MRILPIILAGGSGNRLWPASQPALPKQFLHLMGSRSLLRETFERVETLGDEQAPVILSIERHDRLIRQELAELEPDRIWLEPAGRNTGPSVAWALHEIGPEDGGTVAVFFPSDHHVARPEALRAAVRSAAQAASRTGRLALLGARPDRPETGYGYVETGAELSENVHEVKRFLEKPDAATAGLLSNRQDVLWNCGIFVVPVTPGLELVREVSPSLARFLDGLPEPGSACRPGQPGREQLERAFDAVEAVPFDVAVLERTERCLVVPLEAGWSDLGSWQAVWEVGPRDESDNLIDPGSVAVETAGCLVRAEGSRIAAIGVKDLVIVAWGNAVLVCPRDRAQEIRRLAAELEGGTT